jgi:S-formylglutathione hydrolase FrmB
MAAMERHTMLRDLEVRAYHSICVHDVLRIAVACLFFSFLSGSHTLAGEKNVHTLSHYSTVLHKEQKMNVYVPTTPGRHSVLYLLHGAYGDYTNWVSNTRIAAIAENFDLIIVMPDGAPFSWYTDSPVQPASQYESYIVNELVPFVDSAFATFAEKKGRGICGLSMGGYGAIKFGLKYPSLFASASSMSGILTIMNHASQWKMIEVFGDTIKSIETWKKNDLPQLLLSVKDTIAIKFDTGISDFALADNRQFLSELQKHGFAYEYAEYPGNHSWQYWGMHIVDHLQFHAKMLRQSQ